MACESGELLEPMMYNKGKVVRRGIFIEKHCIQGRKGLRKIRPENFPYYYLHGMDDVCVLN